MPLALTTDSAGRFVVVTITDPYDIREWQRGATALFGDPLYRTRRAALVDRRHCTPPDTPFVSEMMRFCAGHRADLAGTTAAVVVRDDAAFGMSRMAELRVGIENPDFTLLTFRDYDAAVRWLTDQPPKTI